MLERAGELQATAAHILLLLAEDADGSVFRDGRARLIKLLLAHQYAAGKDEGARPLAAGNKLALDQGQIETDFCGWLLFQVNFPAIDEWGL